MATAPLDATPEIRHEFASLEDWQRFLANHPVYLNPEYIDKVAAHIRTNGFQFEFLDHWVIPAEMEFTGDNYRETISFAGINSRQRVILDELSYHFRDRPAQSYRIYSPEALSAFALLLRGRFPKFIGSEYTDVSQVKSDLYPIQVQDLLNLTLRSNTFDAILVNDIFEHVTDLTQTLRELARVLHTGGVLLSTFPFAAFSEQGHVKARLSGSEIEYIEEPEYHGDPLNQAGALVYEIPGWNILKKSREAGFSRAVMIYELSARRGILAPHFGGIFVLLAQR